MSYPAFAAESSYAGPRIEWDASSLTLIARGGGYGRMIRLRDGNILCSYEWGGAVQVRTSTDEGKSWSSPARVAKIGYGTAANPELVQLHGGKLLCCFNERPNDGQHTYAISICSSEDAGESWTAVQRVFEAGTRPRNGCWEPAPLELPGGELQIYFANCSPYGATGEQEISLLRSFDKGRTWQNPITVSFRQRHRDGMPVPILLHEPAGGIAVAIEDNGFPRTFRPVIVYSSGTDWGEGAVLAKSPRRWQALVTPDPSVVQAGAPYLRQMPGGETALSFQCIDAGRTKPHMVVYVGNDSARNFTGRSVPFQVPAGVACLWNSLFVKSPNIVTAISGTKVGEVYGLWAIDGRLIQRKSQ